MEQGAYTELVQAYLQIKDTVLLEGFYALVAGIIVTGFAVRLWEVTWSSGDGKINARAIFTLGKEYLICIGVILLFPVLLDTLETAMAYGAERLTESLGGVYDTGKIWKDPVTTELDKITEMELDDPDSILSAGLAFFRMYFTGDGVLSVALAAIFSVAYEYIMLVFMCTRYLVLLLLEIVSPVAIACLYNGNTRSSFFTWAKALFGVYMMYPAFIIVSMFSDLVVKNYIMNREWPLFIMVIFSFILKTSLLGTAKSTINRWL